MLSSTESARAGRAVRRYLDHLAVERGLAGTPLEAYRRDLRRYVAYLDGRAGGPRSGEVTEQDVAAFLAALREGDADHPPLRGHLGRPRGRRGPRAAPFALREGLAADDPAAAVRPPTPPRRLPKAISRSTTC